MKKIITLSILIPLFLSCNQPKQPTSVNQEQIKAERSKLNYFPEKGAMPIGVYYYPEHWNKNQWERDIKRIADLGFKFIHMAEFAWSELEPEEGVFNFGWLDTCVDLSIKNGLQIVLCTPTPCPPAWLATKYEEVLVMDENLITQRIGGRLQANGMNATYKKFAERIISKLAERYGKNEHVIGWQLDNEPHLSTLFDYSSTSQQRFRIWLKEKYNSIDKLNDAWGTAFWGQNYNNFEQIRIPNSKEGAGGSPHSVVDYKRFTADEIASSLRYQADLLRSMVSSKQWITTNYAYYKFLPTVDLFKNRDDLDFASHTMYLLSTWLNYPEGNMAHRLGSGMELSFSCELARSIKGYTGIMELQPGQINWGAYNSQPLPGAVRMWIWHCYGLGEKFVCTYRYRQPIFGGEMYHNGIMQNDGVTLSLGGKEYVETIQELNKLKQELKDTPQEPKEYASRRTAFLWKQDNLWDLETQKYTNRWDTWQHYYTYYENLKTLGAPVTFIQEKDSFDISKYPFMIAPSYQLIDTNIVAKWTNYVKNGGNLILSCRSGQKDNNGHLWEALWQRPIWNLIGAKIDYFDQLPASINSTINFDGKEYTWNIWGDILIPDDSTTSLAVYKDQFYSGKTGIVTRKLGKGTVTYIGIWSNDHELERMVLRKVYQTAGAKILDLPRYVFAEWREGIWVMVNYSSANATTPTQPNTRFIYGEKVLKPGGVSAWIE